MLISSILRGLLGLVFLVSIGVLFNKNRRNIPWSIVFKGILIQVVFAYGILEVPLVQHFFEYISLFFVKVVSFTQAGTHFLFSSFVTKQIEPALINFVIQVLPTIIFFSALTSLLYYFGILQKIVWVFAWVMKKIMKISGAESLAAAANVFLGQTEAPLLIKPYLPNMTKSEIFCLMCGGMATIAGGVLAAYVGFLGGSDPVQQALFAKHLLAASVMSAPAAIVAAKLLVPETENFDNTLEVSKERIGENALEAIANGTGDGIKLAVNVAAMLLVFTAFITMLNFILKDIVGDLTGANTWIAAHTKFNGLSMQFILGYICAPISWMMGVPYEDIVPVGQLLGEKTILNEFVAYVTLADMKNTHTIMQEKSIIMATYALCGFSNFASIGIQIGGIGSLVPSKRGLLSSLGFKAVLGGTLACFFTAVVVGMFY